MRPRQPQTLAAIFPDLPTTPTAEPMPPMKPHGYRPEKPKARTKSFYEIMQDGETTVVRGYDLLPTLTQRGFTFEVARVAATRAIKHLLAGGGSFELDGLKIRRFEE